MEYYSAIKRNSFESVLMRWMNLETIIQSAISQKGKNKGEPRKYSVQEAGMRVCLRRAQ